MNKSRINIFIALYIFILALVCICSSPLIDCMFTDSAIFIAMGRGMAAGKIIYKELFDHKGLYIFFLNYFAALIDNKSQIGLFIIEYIFMFISAKFVHSSLRLYADEKVSLLGMQILMLFAFMRGPLGGGNFTEEYALMFQLSSIYFLLKYLKDKQARPSYMFVHGVNAGVVLFLRANLVMMWGAIAILIGYELLRAKDYRNFIKNLLAGFLGLLAASLPVIIYLVKTGTVNEGIFAMFTFNMSYINDGQSYLLKVVKTIFNVYFSIIMLMAAILCSLILCFRRKHAIYYLLLLAFSLLSVSLSGRKYGHYYLYLVPFVMPFAYGLSMKLVKYKYAALIIFVISIALGFRPSDKYRPLLGLKTVDTAPFVEYNRKYYSEHEKVLVTGNFAEFYNRLGVIPHEKYFFVPASDYEIFPEPRNSQAQSIISGVNDVIVITTPENYFQETGMAEEINDVLSKNYELLYHDGKNNISMYGRK